MASYLRYSSHWGCCDRDHSWWQEDQHTSNRSADLREPSRKPGKPPSSVVQGFPSFLPASSITLRDREEWSYGHHWAPPRPRPWWLCVCVYVFFSGFGRLSSNWSLFVMYLANQGPTENIHMLVFPVWHLEAQSFYSKLRIAPGSAAETQPVVAPLFGDWPPLFPAHPCPVRLTVTEPRSSISSLLWHSCPRGWHPSLLRSPCWSGILLLENAISICLSVGTLVFVYPPLCLPLYSYKERPANPKIRTDHFLDAVPSEIHEHPLHLMCALEKGWDCDS